MAINWKRFTRKLHYWTSIVIAIPFLIILISGMFLQVKKQVPWIQPTTMEGRGDSPEISFSKILEVARAVPEAKISLQVDHNKDEDWNPKRFRAYTKTHSDSAGLARKRFIKDMVDIGIAAEGYASRTIRGVQLSGDKPYIIELSEGKEINGQVRVCPQAR